MKRRNDKTKIYEILYKILRSVLYFGVAGVGIAYLVFLFMGQDNRVLLHIEIILMLVVSLLWQADILIRKKLHKSNFVNKRDKKHTVAACVALVGGTISAVSYAIMAFCNVPGASAMAIVTVSMVLVTASALAVEHSVSREIKTEEANDDNSNYESSSDSDKEENIKENDEETNDRTAGK